MSKTSSSMVTRLHSNPFFKTSINQDEAPNVFHVHAVNTQPVEVKVVSDMDIYLPLPICQCNLSTLAHGISHLKELKWSSPRV